MSSEHRRRGDSGPMLVCPGCGEMVPLQVAVRVGGRRSFACPACDHEQEWMVEQERVTASS